MALGGLDIGTSGCKVTLFDEEGKKLAAEYSAYSACMDDNRHELDARIVWKHVKQVLARAAKSCPEPVEALAVTTIGEAVVPVGKDGKALAPSILYTDPRGREECAWLMTRMDARHIQEITGTPPHEMYSLPKMMWLSEHTKQVAQATHLRLFQDYFIWLLCGEAKISYSIAARTMAFDIQKKCWCAELLKQAGISQELLSHPVPSGQAVGTLRPELAVELGLSKSLLIVTGAHDQACAALGAGILSPGVSLDGTGTCECIAIPQKKPPSGSFLLENDIACVPHAAGNGYLLYLLVLTCGSMLNWYRTLVTPAQGKIDNSGRFFQQLDAQAGENPSGLLVLPQFSASGTPKLNFSARGAIWGLTVATTKAELYRALMESSTYQMRLSLEILEKNGIHAGPLRAVGGGARSPLWLQIKADILGCEVTALPNSEAGTAGGMLLAAAALGKQEALLAACQKQAEMGRVYHPHPERSRQYTDLYERYKGFYHAANGI